MIEQQKMLVEVTETQSHFAELPAPMPESASVPAEEPIQKNGLAASIRVGNAALDVYEGANAEVVTALCKVLSHVE